VPPPPMCLHPLFVDRGGEGHRHRARRGRGAQSERGVVIKGGEGGDARGEEEELVGIGVRFPTYNQG
jgi:hypothetical protein